MTKLIDLKYFDTVENKNKRILFNCDCIGKIEFVNNQILIDDINGKCIIVMNVLTMKIVQQFIDNLSKFLLYLNDYAFTTIDLT